DHRRPQGVVVVRRHRATVGPGRRDGEQITRTDVPGQELVLHQDVAGLAVLAHDEGQRRWGVGDEGGEGAGVVGVVQGGADVVAHSAVDAYVGAHGPAVQLDPPPGA